MREFDAFGDWCDGEENDINVLDQCPDEGRYWNLVRVARGRREGGERLVPQVVGRKGCEMVKPQIGESHDEIQRSRERKTKSGSGGLEPMKERSICG